MLLVSKLDPLKYKYIRANQGAVMNKDYKNIFHRVKTEEARIAYNKQSA